MPFKPITGHAFISEYAYGWKKQAEPGIEYLTLETEDDEYHVHIQRCPECKVLIECNWVDLPEDQLVGWVCAGCDSVVDNQFDPTPSEQWEVTEGTSERERWETMIRNLP